MVQSKTLANHEGKESCCFAVGMMGGNGQVPGYNVLNLKSWVARAESGVAPFDE